MIRDTREEGAKSPDGTKIKQGDKWVYIPKDKRAAGSNDIEGRPFEKTASGSLYFGEITQEMADKMGTGEAAPIKLSEGNSEYGKKHIEENHWFELMSRYDNVNDFVEDIAQNFNVIYQGNVETDENGKITRSTYVLGRKEANGILYIELIKDTDNLYYSVNSGGFFRVKGKGNAPKELEKRKKGQVVYRRPASKPNK